MTTKAQKAERAEAVERLRAFVRPGMTIYCVLRHVSRSGMQRRIDFYAIDVDEQRGPHLSYLSGLIARTLGYRVHNDGGIVVNGCGMDMGFHVVHNVGRTLWPNGTPEPHGNRNGQPDNDGGYALKSSWI